MIFLEFLHRTNLKADAEAKLAFVEYDNTIDFFAKPRNNAKKKSAKQTPMEAQKMAKKRPIIETVIGIQKNVMDLEHTRHRKATNAFTEIVWFFRTQKSP